MYAMYIVQRDDLRPALIEPIAEYCDNVLYTGETIVFIPKQGFLATVGLFFTENAISYQLEFQKV